MLFNNKIKHDIEYLEAEGAYTSVYLSSGKKKVVSKNLKYFEELLSSFEIFVKVHRSYIVNNQFIEIFHKEGRGVVEMRSGIKIKLSRSFRNNFLKNNKS